MAMIKSLAEFTKTTLIGGLLIVLPLYAGRIYILPPERVHLVDIPFAKAASVISKWGAGARDLRAAMIRSGTGVDSLA